MKKTRAARTAAKTAAHTVRHDAAGASAVRAAAAGTAVKAGVTAKLVSGFVAAAILIGGIGAGVAIRLGLLPVDVLISTAAATVEESAAPEQEPGIAVIIAEEPGTAEQAESPAPEEAESLTVRRARAILLYKNFVIDEGFDDNTRFCLYDVDGDGIEELLLIRAIEYLYESPLTQSAEAYTVRDGQVVPLGAQDGSMAGAGKVAVELLTLRGRAYMALLYTNGEWNYDFSYAVLLEADRLDAAHSVSVRINYDPEFYHQRITSADVLLDGQAIDYAEWEQALANATILLRSFNAEGMSLAEFYFEAERAAADVPVERATVSSDSGEAYMAAYAPVFETYRTYLSADEETKSQMTNNDHGRGPEDAGVGYLCQYCTELGYCFLDLNGDGLPELIVSSHESEYYSDVIYELYTLKEGRPYRVLASHARERYRLYPGGLICNDGSSGAKSNCCWLYRLSGYTLEPISALINENDEFFQITGARSYPYTKQPEDVTLTRAEYSAKVRGMIAETLSPELTPFT